jgi:hypothetical protein
LREKAFHTYTRTLESHLTERLFQVKFKGRTTSLRKTEAGVLQESALGPVLYLTYSSDLQTSDNTTVTFGYHTAMLATHEEQGTASVKLQATFNKTGDWAKKR